MARRELWAVYQGEMFYCLCDNRESATDSVSGRLTAHHFVEVLPVEPMAEKQKPPRGDSWLQWLIDQEEMTHCHVSDTGVGYLRDELAYLEGCREECESRRIVSQEGSL